MTTNARMLRLGGFFSVPGNHLAGWRHPDAIPTYDMDFQGYAHITQVAEAAKFDCIFFQDTVGVSGSRAAGPRRAGAGQALAHGEARADRDAGGPRHGDRAHRPRGDGDHDLQRALQHRPPLHVDRPHQRRPRRLEPGDLADRGRVGEFRLRPAHAACRALRARRGVLRGRHRPVGFVGGRRRPAARQGERPLHGPRQGPFPRPCRQALQGQGTAQHHALGPGLAGDRPGGLVRGRPRPRRAHRRRGVHGADQDRRGQGVLRRHQEARGDVRPGARGHQDHAGPDAGAGQHDGTRRRRTTRSCSR